MADSGFWHDLAGDFRTLQTTRPTFRADYSYTLGSGRGEWKLKDAGRRAAIQFETLAIRGASALPRAEASGLYTWLEALRLANGYFNFRLVGIEPPEAPR